MKRNKKILIATIVLTMFVLTTIDIVKTTKQKIENDEPYEYDSSNTTSNTGSHYVKGYTRKDGTTVKGHYRK